MLRACGIVAEYNPFHHGHAYHIAHTKKRMTSDVVVAVMSGNFVQRGELACASKWDRAKAALLAGVDVVVELPTMFSVQSADFFARGAMKVMQQLNIAEVSFGIETPLSIEQLQQLAKEPFCHAKDFTRSYAQQWQQQNEHLKMPNQLLAVQYMKAAHQLDHPIRVLPIERLHSLHTDQQLPSNQSIASATAIRMALKRGEDIRPFLPSVMRETLFFSQRAEDLFFELLKYQLRIHSYDALRDIYQVVEGIEYVLKREVAHAKDYDDFLNRCQSKRFNRKRLQRVCLYIVLQLTNQTVHQTYADDRVPVRVLGFSPKGRDYLRQLDTNTYVTQLKKEHITLFEEQLRVDSIYEQLTGATEQNLRRVVRVDENYTTL